jgi:adenosylhomocysteine nucleosidase
MLERVAFICAMPMELTPLKRKLSLEKTRVGLVEIHIGLLGERPVVAIVTGIGTALATAGLERLVETIDVERVVVVGITGAVGNETPVGTLILPEVVVNSTTGAEYRPDRLGEGKPSGKMWTSDVLITDLDVIGCLRAKGVVSLDMETAAVAEVCERRNIPWSVFRVISDHVTDGSVNEEVFRLSNQDGTLSARAVTAYLLKHPRRIPGMARMARGVKSATNHAAAAAISAVSQLPIFGP